MNINSKKDKRLLKYKYIIVSYGYDYYDYVYRQFENCSYAKYVHNIKFPFLIEIIFYRFITFSDSNLCFNRLWAKLYLYYIDRYVKTIASSDDNICFVLLAGGLNLKLLNYGLTEEIKRKYPTSKVVYYISDVSDSTRSYLPLIKSKSDLVITFDPGDAQKYNFLYHTIPYSLLNFSKHNAKIECDLSFVGIAKERLNDLISLCMFLREKDVKCRFVIVKVPESQRIYCEGIEYRDWVSYEENLKILLSSKCILDFTKKIKCEGNTLRVGEAVMLGKKLLTNNPHIINNGIYEEKYMKYFTLYEEIDTEFIKSHDFVNYSIKDKLLPKNLLYFIEHNLHNE